MEKKERTGRLINMTGKYLLILLTCLCVYACKQDSPPPVDTSPIVPVAVPASNADSLYAFVEKQLSFGHRYPSAPGHLKIKEWIKAKMNSYGATVIEQPFKASFYSVVDADAFNIIASFNPSHKKRILLAAHYDSRIVAEKDMDNTKKDDPIMGADDGASGVAGLLEIARVIKQNPIDLGVDFIFFDAEDNGRPKDSNLTWCLGSQHWAKNKHDKDYTADFGILLDMIGAKGASFGKELISQQNAKRQQDKIWELAQRMGYGDYFIDARFGSIEDDHKYVNQAGIPMLDIINYDVTKNDFAHYHHTHKDDISIIDKRTLRVVSQVVLATLYKFSDRTL